MIRSGVLIDFKNLSPIKDNCVCGDFTDFFMFSNSICSTSTVELVEGLLWKQQDPLFWWVLLNGVLILDSFHCAAAEFGGGDCKPLYTRQFYF